MIRILSHQNQMHMLTRVINSIDDFLSHLKTVRVSISLPREHPGPIFVFFYHSTIKIKNDKSNKGIPILFEASVSGALILWRRLFK